MAAEIRPDLETLPCGCILFKPDGEVLYINQTLIAWLRYDSKQELTGKPVESLFTIK